MPTPNVPDMHLQIKAIRAQVKYFGKPNYTICWLGLQGGKYVSLPMEWVHANFDQSILDEALKRANATMLDSSQKFLTIPPPGDWS